MAMRPIGNRNNKFVGLSTDARPSDSLIYAGATLYEWDTGILFLYNGEAWVPKPQEYQMVSSKVISLNQAAAAYDVFTATTQNIFMDAVLVNVPANLSAVATFTGISVQTTDDTPQEILSTTDGAKAKLTGDFYHVYRGPAVNASTKKIQLSIIGATAGTGAAATVVVLWRPVVAGGYYA
jgi:hypothetical protein